MCFLSLMDVYLISYQYDMDLMWMELRITSQDRGFRIPNQTGGGANGPPEELILCGTTFQNNYSARWMGGGAD